MARVIHRHPDDCIPQMGFDCYDGGRSDYFNLRLGMDVPNDIQDCAVVAVSVALTYYPRVSSSPALSYSATLSELRNMNLRKRPWMSKGFRETRKKFVVRRFREIIEERKKKGNCQTQRPKIRCKHRRSISSATVEGLFVRIRRTSCGPTDMPVLI